MSYSFKLKQKGRATSKRVWIVEVTKTPSAWMFWASPSTIEYHSKYGIFWHNSKTFKSAGLKLNSMMSNFVESMGV